MAKKDLCLVTGGAGFIGSHLVEALLKRGYPVRVLDDLSTGKASNLQGIRGDIHFQKGSICKETDIRKAVRGVKYVFHIGANRAVLRSVDNPLETNDVNVTGTLRLLVAARDFKVKRFIFSSAKYYPILSNCYSKMIKRLCLKSYWILIVFSNAIRDSIHRVYTSSHI